MGQAINYLTDYFFPLEIIISISYARYYFFVRDDVASATTRELPSPSPMGCITFIDLLAPRLQEGVLTNSLGTIVNSILSIVLNFHLL